MNGHMTFLQFLERIPDDYMPKRRALIAELKAQQAAPALPPAQQAAQGGDVVPNTEQPMNSDIPTGGGYGNLQRAINQAGSTEGMI